MSKRKDPLAELRSRVAFLEGVNTTLRDENKMLRTGNSDPIVNSLKARLADVEHDRDQAWARYRETMAELTRAEIDVIRARQGGTAPFNKTMWRRLVQLAHPDKHGGSTASTEATRWLMENRP
jgi:hypothetical protein